MVTFSRVVDFHGASRTVDFSGGSRVVDFHGASRVVAMSGGGIAISLAITQRAPASAATPAIGGIELGTAGGPSDAYVLSAGDDFDGALDIITPDNPFGKYSPTRAYMIPGAEQGPRQAGATGFGLFGYDVDPAHTGYNDANRGVARASWADCMVQESSALALKSRVATTEEKALFHPSPLKDNCSAMVCSPGGLVFTPPFYIEFRTAFESDDLRGWHPSEWLMQMNSARTYNDLEVDWEGYTDYDKPNVMRWTDGSNSASAGSSVARTNDGTYILFGIEVLANGNTNFYRNGSLSRAYTLTSFTFDPAKPFFWLLTNHITDFGEDPLTQADWDTAGATGAVQRTDYVRVWRDPSGAHYEPQIANQTFEFDADEAFSEVLPTATTVWGSDVDEVVEAYMVEANEPGGGYDGGYDGFPAGVSYDPETRTLAGTLDTPGTLHIVRYVTEAGSTCEPHKVALHIGPKWTVATLQMDESDTIDLYPLADCGQLTSIAGARAKTIEISAPGGSGLTLVGDLLTSSTDTGTFDVDMTVTNSRGQEATATISVTVGQTLFMEDTFTEVSDIQLLDHTGETGAEWSGITGSNGSAVRVGTGGTAYASTGAGSNGFAAASAVPPGANYRVDATLDFKTLVSGEAGMGIAGRIQSGVQSFYFARYGESAGAWQIYKTVSGTTTLLGSASASRPSGEVDIALIMNGSTISMEVEGVERISVSDASITGAGSVGIRTFTAVTSTTGQHLSYLSASAL